MCGIEFLCWQLSCWILKWEAKPRNGVTLAPVHVMTLKEKLKYQLVYQASPKYSQSDSNCEIQLWSLYLLKIIILKDNLQQACMVKSYIIINQNNSSSIWTDVLIKDFIPISHTCQSFSMSTRSQCGHRERSLDKP
ncbi:hypothetical protein TNCV_1687791 [Trichonephila clavipes]|nr:hypothetical protein TNCV_1687791 [Trichonephila clavipes]